MVSLDKFLYTIKTVVPIRFLEKSKEFFKISFDHNQEILNEIVTLFETLILSKG